MVIYYKYLYYFLYNHLQKKGKKNAIPLTTRVHGLLGILDVIFLGGLLYEYTIVFGFTLDITPTFGYIVVGILTAYHLWLFSLNNKQLRYVEEFAAWPTAKQNKWNRIMRIVITLIIVNFLISLFLMQVQYGK